MDYNKFGMKVSKIKFSDKILSSKPVLKTLKFASDNPALFAATTTTALSTVIRPAVIYSAPATDKREKRYALVKSLSSSAVGFALSYAVSKPIERAVKNIDKNPKAYLKNSSIKNLTNKEIAASKNYMFSTRIFKSAATLLTAFPKSALTCALIPVVMKKLFPSEEKKTPSFKGKPLEKGIGKVIDTKFMQKFADKFSDTNIIQHISALTDVLLTGAFVQRVLKNDKIENDDKKPLILNYCFYTALSLICSYSINNLTDKPTEKFIEKFSKVNKNLPDLKKYAEGIKISKTIFVIGGVYYAVIPFISTILAGKCAKFFKGDEKKFENKF